MDPSIFVEETDKKYYVEPLIIMELSFIDLF